MVETSRGEGASLSPRRPEVWKLGMCPTMRVQKLETQCLPDWSPMKNELEDIFRIIGSSVDRTWRYLTPGKVGGKRSYRGQGFLPSPYEHF